MSHLLKFEGLAAWSRKAAERKGHWVHCLVGGHLTTGQFTYCALAELFHSAGKVYESGTLRYGHISGEALGVKVGRYSMSTWNGACGSTSEELKASFALFRARHELFRVWANYSIVHHQWLRLARAAVQVGSAYNQRECSVINKLHYAHCLYAKTHCRIIISRVQYFSKSKFALSKIY